MDNFLFNFTEKISERALSQRIGLSRSTIRKAIKGDDSLKVSTIKSIADFFGQTIKVLAYPKDHTPDCTTVTTGFRIMKDGHSSWKLHLMNMVDEFRETQDIRLFLLSPDQSCSKEICTIMASTVIELCEEVGIPAPEWALKTKPLESPWFVSGMESLKASALLESPVSFRSKNIFVHENFLKRA